MINHTCHTTKPWFSNDDCSKSPIYSLQWFLTWFAYLQSKFFAMTDKLVWDFFRSSLHSNRSCWHSWGKFKSCVHKRWGLNCNIILDCIVCKCFFSYYEPWFNFLRESLQLVFLGFFSKQLLYTCRSAKLVSEGSCQQHEMQSTRRHQSISYWSRGCLRNCCCCFAWFLSLSRWRFFRGGQESSDIKQIKPIWLWHYPTFKDWEVSFFLLNMWYQ